MTNFFVTNIDHYGVDSLKGKANISQKFFSSLKSGVQGFNQQYI